MCRPKRQGGQGIINLNKWNMITMLKCLWNLCRKSDNLWVKWVNIYYLKGDNVMDVVIPKNSSWVINKILDMREEVHQHLGEWNNMLNLNKFKMSKTYMVIHADDETVDWRALFYHNIARPRAQFTTWLTCHRKLATKDRLLRFNMIVDSECDICKQAEESRSHLFFECNSNDEIWQQVLMWLKIDHKPLQWQEELKWIIKVISNKGSKAKVLKMAFVEVIYGIWARQNDIVYRHNSNTDFVQDIMDCIVYRCWQYRDLRN